MFILNPNPASIFCPGNVVCFFTSAAYIHFMYFRLYFFMEANKMLPDQTDHKEAVFLSLYILPGARFRALSAGVHCTLRVV